MSPGKSTTRCSCTDPPGVGKTHLLHALGNELMAQSGGAFTVAVVNASQFIDELIAALQEEQIEKWRARYRVVDALILDDVDRCAGKERSQEELFHIFNSLAYNGRQIVFASVHAPKAIEGLEERLRSRFEGGLVVEIQPPDHALREKLYARYLSDVGERLDRPLVDFLASRSVPSVAEMRGIVDRLMKAAAVVGVPLNASFARKELEGGATAPAPTKQSNGRDADPFFLDEEKILWDWPDVTGRAIEEFR